MGAIAAVLLALSMGQTTYGAAAEQSRGPSCSKKRVDACGCHHVYGLRHCHPNRKTPKCEAPVKATAPEETKKAVFQL